MTASTTGTIAVDSRFPLHCGVDSSGRLDSVLLKTASRCNIDCSYCYVYQGPDTTWRLQPKRMQREVVEAVCERLIEQAGRQERGFAIVLHGGEPLLLGFDGLAALLRGLRTHLSPERHPISIQTNGMLLCENLLDLFCETRTSVSVSIDGPSEANDLARLDHRGRSTYAATMRGIQLLTSHSETEFLFAGTLSVIQPAVSPTLVYQFLKALGTPNMDFLLQDGNYDRLPRENRASTAPNMGSGSSACSTCTSLIRHRFRFVSSTTRSSSASAGGAGRKAQGRISTGS